MLTYLKIVSLRIFIIEVSTTFGLRFGSFRHTLDLGLSTYGSQDKSDLLPCVLVYVNKVLLEHSHANLLMDYLWLLLHYNNRIDRTQRLYGLQSLKYLLCGPLWKKKSDLCSNARFLNFRTISIWVVIILWCVCRGGLNILNVGYLAAPLASTPSSFVTTKNIPREQNNFQLRMTALDKTDTNIF